MATFFLLLIYATFVSLGLPDTLLGAAWPMMHLDLGVPLDAAGVVTILVACCTTVSSLLSERVIRRFGTGKVTAVSVLATALAMLGISFVPNFVWLILLAIPLGLGAGAIDTGLNNYVALNYAARHMNWLHCFWGVGAFGGPMILSFFMVGEAGWRGGYRAVSIIQVVICVALFITLPLWKRFDKTANLAPEEKPVSPLTARGAFTLRGVKPAVLVFCVYCGVESSTGLWASTFLVEQRGFAAASAARASGLFFGCIALGRFLSGLLTSRFSGRALIRGGVLLVAAGCALLCVPVGGALPWIAIVLMGLGAAPVFPGSIKETPARFGQENSQKIIGFEMAAAYVGILSIPALMGVVAARVSVALLPFILLGLTACLLALTERAARAGSGKAV